MNAAACITMDSPLTEVNGLSVATLKMLEKEGLLLVSDLLSCFPSRHEDRRRLGIKGFAPSETPVCHQVCIVSTRLLRFGGSGGAFEAVVEALQDNPMNQQLTLRWFRMPFLQRALAVDMELVVYGKIKEVKTRLIMDHPEYEVIRTGDEDEVGMHTGRIVPVYALRGGLKQKLLRSTLWLVLRQLPDEAVPDILPKPKTVGEFAGLSRVKALRTVHHPAEMMELEGARRYLALEEFYLMQLRVLRRRLRYKNHGGWSQQPAGHLETDFLKSLPFVLTEAQSRCLEEIKADMAMTWPMNRLLHGDVGSGKTVVALAAALVAIESGQQAALMAPTQILAEQHFRKAREWLEPLGVRVALRTGEKSEGGEAMELFGDTGQAHLFIGTHALLYDDASLSRLGLVVIDEQHKFGVAQRARLIARGRAPDVLVMTATPIPRTLTLTLYGDLDVSTIDQRPKERGKVVTAVRTPKKLKEVTAFVLTQLAEGRQCYLVYPLIEESEKLDASAATTGFAEWSQKLAPHIVGLLHGRLDAPEKEGVMRRFRSGEIQALVSTTVIEVGVDVPNATVMLIHDAARFGLAQLHQLRGRIGRGSHHSYCVLFVAEKDEEARTRLHILEETTDGFRIAEEDLKRRGPGDVLGRAQSGQSPLRFGELLADTRLVTLARRLAERTLKDDPELVQPAQAHFRSLVLERDAPVATMQ